MECSPTDLLFVPPRWSSPTKIEFSPTKTGHFRPTRMKAIHGTKMRPANHQPSHRLRGSLSPVLLGDLRGGLRGGLRGSLWCGIQRLSVCLKYWILCFINGYYMILLDIYLVTPPLDALFLKEHHLRSYSTHLHSVSCKCQIQLSLHVQTAAWGHNSEILSKYTACSHTVLFVQSNTQIQTFANWQLSTCVVLQLSLSLCCHAALRVGFQTKSTALVRCNSPRLGQITPSPTCGELPVTAWGMVYPCFPIASST